MTEGAAAHVVRMRLSSVQRSGRGMPFCREFIIRFTGKLILFERTQFFGERFFVSSGADFIPAVGVRRFVAPPSGPGTGVAPSFTAAFLRRVEGAFGDDDREVLDVAFDDSWLMPVGCFSAVSSPRAEVASSIGAVKRDSSSSIACAFAQYSSARPSGRPSASQR